MIAIEGLSAGYERGRETVAVDALTIGAGALTVVIGRNGSGKSTLLKVLAGMKQYRGSVRIDGRETRDYTPRERARRLAYLPQQLAAPDMDVETLVSHGRFAHQRFAGALGAEDREMIERAMERTDVAALRCRRLRTLSGGERQRAYLAMVIAQDAQMLLLDEPCAGLDVSHQLEVLAILRALTAEGRGILMTSHDIPQSLSAGELVCLLDAGALRYCGTPAQLASPERQPLLRETLGIGVRQLVDGADVCGERALYPYILTAERGDG